MSEFKVFNDYDEFAGCGPDQQFIYGILDKIKKEAKNSKITESMRSRNTNMKLNENQKVTLSIGQLKRLVKESAHLSPWERREKQTLFIRAINKLHYAIGSLEALAKDPDIAQFYKKARGVELNDAIPTSDLTAAYAWLEDFRNEYFGLA